MSPERVCFHLPDAWATWVGCQVYIAGLRRWYLNCDSPGVLYMFRPSRHCELFITGRGYLSFD